MIKSELTCQKAVSGYPKCRQKHKPEAFYCSLVVDDNDDYDPILSTVYKSGRSWWRYLGRELHRIGMAKNGLLDESLQCVNSNYDRLDVRRRHMCTR